MTAIAALMHGIARQKLASLILLPHSDILVSNITCVNINTASCSTWRQTTAVVNRARPSSRRWCGHSTVAKRVRHSEAVVNNRRPLC